MVVDRSSRLNLGRNKYEKHHCIGWSLDHFWRSIYRQLDTPRHVMLQLIGETPLSPFQNYVIHGPPLIIIVSPPDHVHM